MAHRFAAARLVASPDMDTDAAFADEDLDHAPLSSRVLAYAIDSIALLGLALLFFAVAGANIYLRTNGGRSNLTDAEVRDSFIIMMAAIPCWLLLNLWLEVRRGQTAGKYVLGLQAARVDGREAGLSRHLLHWLALHPLLFHPLIGVFLAIFAAYSVSFAESPLLLYGGSAAALLCFLAPIAGFFFALGDSQRRGIHDWLAAMKVVRVD